MVALQGPPPPADPAGAAHPSLVCHSAAGPGPVSATCKDVRVYLQNRKPFSHEQNHHPFIPPERKRRDDFSVIRYPSSHTGNGDASSLVCLFL